MQRDRLVVGLTTMFAAVTAFALLAGVALLEPVLFVVAAPLAAATALFWYHSSGRLHARVRRSQAGASGGGGRQRGGFGAGPRGGFESAGGQRAQGQWERRERERQRRQRDPRTSASMRRDEAYRRLGLEDGADEEAVRRAYREKVKAVHPDRGGDEEAFMEVTEAYETLTR